MGFGNAQSAWQRWGVALQDNHTSMLALVVMAIYARDCELPRYYAGWQPIAQALGKQKLSEQAQMNAVRKALVRLRAVGAIQVVTPSAPGRATVYSLDIGEPGADEHSSVSDERSGTEHSSLSDERQTDEHSSASDERSDAQKPRTLVTQGRNTRHSVTSPRITKVLRGEPQERKASQQRHQSATDNMPAASVDSDAPQTTTVDNWTNDSLDERGQGAQPHPQPVVPQPPTDPAHGTIPAARPAVAPESGTSPGRRRPARPAPRVLHIWPDTQRRVWLRMNFDGSAWLTAEQLAAHWVPRRHAWSMGREHLPDLFARAQQDHVTAREHPGELPPRAPGGAA